ncbi:MAG: cysteine synthase family protein [Chryseolinea sp.]
MSQSNNILDAIGNTPLVKLKKIVPENSASVYVKLEYFNPTGSYKDRMALAIIEGAEKRGALKHGMTVVECTGGSTGTSMAFVCAIKNYAFRVVSSDAFAKEKLMSMRLFGANLELVQSEGGMITPNLIPKMIERAKEITTETNGYWTMQFENKDAFEGYKKLGYEITEQLNSPVDLFCAGVGTAGMFMGVAQALRSKNKQTKLVALEPASAPLLSKGIKGSHKVEGIATGIVPPLLDKAYYDSVEAIEESDARIMAKRLAAEEGILAGTSSGLNVAAAIKLAKELGPGHNIVTVACDSGMKYFASGLFN